MLNQQSGQVGRHTGPPVTFNVNSSVYLFIHLFIQFWIEEHTKPRPLWDKFTRWGPLLVVSVTAVFISDTPVKRTPSVRAFLCDGAT